jgi:hypothetical protein
MAASAVSATSDGSEMNQLSEILGLLKPFIPSIKQIMERPLCKATAFEFALYMIGDIITKLNDLIEKNVIFSKIVISRLWNCETPAGPVNIIELLYSFLTLSGRYPDAEFKRATFGAIVPFNKGKADLNYNITPQQAHIPLGECRFVLAFKLWRSIVGRSITNCTGKYQKPNFKESATWSYRVQNGKDVKIVKAHTDADFMEFMEDWSEIYEKSDKFSPSLDEVHSIFNEASTLAKAEISAKIEARALRESRNPREHREHRESRQRHEPRPTQRNSQNAVITPITKTIPSLPLPPPPSRWGTTAGGAAALFKS